jgi:hypothetical protein
MKILNLKNYFVAAALIVSSFAQAQISLPLHTLRDQGTTDHCWAYSMSHILESRALSRDSQQIHINTEKDVKYWVDYERMMYIFRTKNKFYLGDYEGGWQIEFFESLIKHGKNIYNNAIVTPQIVYQPFAEYFSNMRFFPEPRPRPDKTLPSWESAASSMKRFTNEKEAHNYAINYLNRMYGPAQTTTLWNGQNVSISKSAQLILGDDYANNNSAEAVVLVKPIFDNQIGWAKYLDNRYWGYRYNIYKVLSLVELSLDNKFPVAYDNEFHAKTILAYAVKPDGTRAYAIADSIPGKITWLDANWLLNELNLVTFFKQALGDTLPPRTQENLLQLRLPMGTTLDQFDHVSFPPR